jgi:hypothetical protein
MKNNLTFVFTEAVDDADHAFQSPVLLQVVLDQFGLVRSVSALASSPFPGGTLPLLWLLLSLLSPLQMLLLLLALAFGQDGQQNGEVH